MGKYLLNYTSRVPAHKSISEIQEMLARAGARKIMHEYDDANTGYITALSFTIELEGQEIGFRLPTDWRPVLQILQDMRRQNTKLSRDIAEQAHALNVAWRITKDWVEAQLAILETKMVTTQQLFLPYAITKNGNTLYEHIAANPGLLLGDGSGS